MSRHRLPSLKRRLIGRLLGFQIGILLFFGIALVAFLIRADEGGALVDPDFTGVAARAISRDAQGGLHLDETAEFAALRRATPDLWFVARSDRGGTITYGKVPDLYRPLANNLDRITFADIRDTTPPFRDIAVVRRAEGPVGTFTVLGKGSLYSMTFVVLFLSNLVMIPVLALLAIITVVATPLIVRRAFRHLAVTALEAGRIDIDSRGFRLSANGIPAEIVPLVDAMNGALRRLDEGYDRHQRFLIEAAHELRTPIAILQAKIETAPDSALARHLHRDVARLATLAEQMLDLQRLDRGIFPEDAVDLGQVAQGVVADLAPLVIASGGELEMVDFGTVSVCGDRAAIERVLANLIQNAVEHGGRRIVVRVDGTTAEVEDDGPGIPASERDHVFEPFHRLRPQSTGAGLGLNLVRQVMARHGGLVEALDARATGTIMRLEFVAATQG